MPDLYRPDGSRIHQASACRFCGCTEENPCVVQYETGPAFVCSWVEPDLCSACLYSVTLSYAGVGIDFNLAEIVAVENRFDTESMRALTDVKVRLRHVAESTASGLPSPLEGEGRGMRGDARRRITAWPEAEEA